LLAAAPSNDQPAGACSPHPIPYIPLTDSVALRNVTAMAPSPKGLALDLLSTVRTGSMPVRALVAAGGLFGIEENRLRVALTRMLSDGLLDRDQRGAYRLRRSRGVSALVTGWRRIESGATRWNGHWIAVLAGTVSRSTASASSPARGARRAEDRALRLLGFRWLQRGVAIRPANFTESLAETRTRLIDLGLRPESGVACLDEVDDATRSHARTLWDTAGLRREYARAIAQLDASRQRLPRMTEARAMVESFRVGGNVIRQIVRDPLLPPPLVPAGELAGVVRAMRAYDNAGRACWRPFLERHGIDFADAPAGVAAHESGSRDHAFGGIA